MASNIYLFLTRKKETPKDLLSRPCILLEGGWAVCSVPDPFLTVRAITQNIGDASNYKVVWRRSKFFLEPRSAGRDHIHGQRALWHLSLQSWALPRWSELRGGGGYTGGLSWGPRSACMWEAVRSQMLVIGDGRPASHLEFPFHSTALPQSRDGGGGVEGASGKLCRADPPSPSPPTPTSCLLSLLR